MKRHDWIFLAAVVAVAAAVWYFYMRKGAKGAAPNHGTSGAAPNQSAIGGSGIVEGAATVYATDYFQTPYY
jgi:hypothetical protein